MVVEEIPTNKKVENPVMTSMLKMSLKNGVTDINYGEYCANRNRIVENDMQISI